MPKNGSRVAQYAGIGTRNLALAGGIGYLAYLGGSVARNAR